MKELSYMLIAMNMCQLVHQEDPGRQCIVIVCLL